jgi:hypothetical protein
MLFRKVTLKKKSLAVIVADRRLHKQELRFSIVIVSIPGEKEKLDRISTY